MNPYVAKSTLPKFKIWEAIKGRRVPIHFNLEISARCNNNCTHCYINLPAKDQEAKQKELSPLEIAKIADQAIELGALWCLITGGEPLLRRDFSEIYTSLRKKGLLLSVFTNACLVTERHLELFEKYPPRDIEVTVYGVTESTYERVTRKAGSYEAFRRGLELLLQSGLRVHLKAMALRSNVDELPAIAEFCRLNSSEIFRFDPQLHLRYDRNEMRNKEIQSERLSPREIASIEQADDERARALEKDCDSFIFPLLSDDVCNHLFHCGAGNSNFTVSYDGIFRLCADLWHPDCTYDLRKGTLAEAWNELVPRVREMHAGHPEQVSACHTCNIINLCLQCPAHAHLETGSMEGETPYFCEVAHARAKAIEDRISGINNG